MSYYGEPWVLPAAVNNLLLADDTDLLLADNTVIILAE